MTYFLRRILGMVPVLFVTWTLVFVVLEIIPGDPPLVPIMVRSTTETRRLVAALFDAGVLATGLAYPVVPRGDESIRFQINADHTEAGIDQVLGVLSAARKRQ